MSVGSRMGQPRQVRQTQGLGPAHMLACESMGLAGTSAAAWSVDPAWDLPARKGRVVEASTGSVLCHQSWGNSRKGL